MFKCGSKASTMREEKQVNIHIALHSHAPAKIWVVLGMYARTRLRLLMRVSRFTSACVR